MMSNRLVPAGEFAHWLEKEARKRSHYKTVDEKYLANAVGNAYGRWSREFSDITDQTLLIESYRLFYAWALGGASRNNLQVGTAQGYAVVAKMLTRVGAGL